VIEEGRQAILCRNQLVLGGGDERVSGDRTVTTCRVLGVGGVMIPRAMSAARVAVRRASWLLARGFLWGGIMPWFIRLGHGGEFFHFGACTRFNAGGRIINLIAGRAKCITRSRETGVSREGRPVVADGLACRRLECGDMCRF